MVHTPEAERAALEELLQSDGWAIFTAAMGQAWGPEAFERKLDETLNSASLDDELAITKRVRDTFKGVRASLTWPEERVRALKAGVAKPPIDPFARFRRRA